MKIATLLKSAAIGAGLCIFAVGLVLAQTPPAPPASPPAAQTTPPASAAPGGRHAMREACRAEIKAELQGAERQEAMRKCIADKRAARREAAAPERAKRREAMRTCRESLRNQRFTEDERREAILECVGKTDPQVAKMITCRKEAAEKKLERGTSEFRSAMRGCMTRV